MWELTGHQAAGASGTDSTGWPKHYTHLPSSCRPHERETPWDHVVICITGVLPMLVREARLLGGGLQPTQQARPQQSSLCRQNSCLCVFTVSFATHSIKISDLIEFLCWIKVFKLWAAPPPRITAVIITWGSLESCLSNLSEVFRWQYLDSVVFISSSKWPAFVSFVFVHVCKTSE